MKAIKIILLVCSFGITILALLIIYNFIKFYVSPEKNIIDEPSDGIIAICLTVITLALSLLSSFSLFRQIQTLKDHIKFYEGLRGLIPVTQVVFGFWMFFWASTGVHYIFNASSLSKAKGDDYFELILFLILLIALILLGLAMVIDFFRSRKVSKKRLNKFATSFFGSKLEET